MASKFFIPELFDTTEIVTDLSNPQSSDNEESWPYPKGYLIPVEMIGPTARTPICTTMDCVFKSECAQHTTAGDFRSEDGMTPELTYEDRKWYCTKKDSGNNFGLVVLHHNGTVGRPLR